MQTRNMNTRVFTVMTEFGPTDVGLNGSRHLLQE